MRSLFRSKPAPSPLNPALGDAIIELCYAGNALALALVVAPHGKRFCTLCGADLDASSNQSQHDDNCPVQRHTSAIDAMRKAVIA